MRKKLKKPIQLKEVMNDMFKESVRGSSKGLKTTIEPTPLLSLQEAWKELVGPQLGKKSRPARLLGKKLLIEVTSASWANEMEFLKRELLNRVRMHVPEAGIEDLRCQVTTRSSGSSGLKTSPLKSLG